MSFSKSINKLYDEHILSDGGFDERVFLRSDANIEIGTPQKSLMSSVNAATGDANVRRRSLNFAVSQGSLSGPLLFALLDYKPVF